MADNNYVVGRGRLFFGQYKPGTRNPKGQLYFGNTPELSLSQDEDTLDHYSSEGGVRVKDASVTLQNDSSGSFQCDNINDANLALWFRGIIQSRIEAGSATASGTITFSTAVPADGDSVTIDGNEITFVAADPEGMEVLIAATIGAQATALANFINSLSSALGVVAEANAAVVTVKALGPGTAGNAITLAKNAATPANITVSGGTLTGGTDVEETINDVETGRWYQLGVTDATPAGLTNLGTVVVKVGGSPIDDDNYVFEANTGRLFIKEDAPDIASGTTDITVGYGVTAGIESLVIAKGETIEGELQFIANNAAGENRDYYWPYVRLTPDGDLALKGDDWQTVTFNFEILKKDEVTERQYIRRRPATVVA